MDSITLDQNNSIILEGGSEDLELARKFVSSQLVESRFNDRDGSLLVLAVDEALSHIVSYTDELGSPHKIRLGVDVDETRFVARIQDSCTDFGDRLHVPRDEDLRSAANKGQLGIYLIRQIMDEVKYTYRRGFENELVLLRFVP